MLSIKRERAEFLVVAIGSADAAGKHNRKQNDEHIAPIDDGVRPSCTQQCREGNVMKFPHRRQFLHLTAAAAALPALPGVATADDYPSKAVRILVGYAAGGTT